MKTEKQKPLGLKIWSLVKSENDDTYHSLGAVFVKKSSVKLNPGLDGLIQNQTGPSVFAETYDGIPILGMLARSE